MDKSLIVTKEIAVKALLFGACRIPKIGSKIEEYSQSDLIWAERLGIKLKELLWIKSVDGSGDGSGYGSGDGSGYGYGDGSGSGYGDGYGYGYGDGSGSGYGDGSGYGYGSGYGSGSGYGDGSGYGSGYGDGYLYDKIPEILNSQERVTNQWVLTYRKFNPKER